MASTDCCVPSPAAGSRCRPCTECSASADCPNGRRSGCRAIWPRIRFASAMRPIASSSSTSSARSSTPSTRVGPGDCRRSIRVGVAACARQSSGEGLAAAGRGNLGSTRRAAALHPFQSDGVGGAGSMHSQHRRVWRQRAGLGMARAAPSHTRRNLQQGLRSGPAKLRAGIWLAATRREPAHAAACRAPTADRPARHGDRRRDPSPVAGRRCVLLLYDSAEAADRLRPAKVPSSPAASGLPKPDSARPRGRGACSIRAAPRKCATTSGC